MRTLSALFYINLSSARIYSIGPVARGTRINGSPYFHELFLTSLVCIAGKERKGKECLTGI